MRLPLPTRGATDATVARSARGVDVGVCLVIWVALGAVCLGALLRPTDPSSITPAHVHAMRHQLQMVGIDASRDATQVINIHPIQHWADECFVRETMSGHNAAAIPKHAVTKRDVCGSPQPASVGLADFGPEPFKSGARWTREPAGDSVVLHAVIIQGMSA